MRLVGIDPGREGAAALYVTPPKEFYGVVVDVIDLPLTELDGDEIVDAVALLRRIQAWKPDEVWLERVWAMPSFPDKKTGERRQMGAATSFKFGDHNATIRTTIILDGWKLRRVTSPTWKGFYGLHGPDKEQSRQRALELMPAAAEYLTRKKDSGRAEAMLISRYGATMAWTKAGGAVPAAEVARGRELAARLKAQRQARRPGGRLAQAVRPPIEEVPD